MPFLMNSSPPSSFPGEPHGMITSLERSIIPPFPTVFIVNCISLNQQLIKIISIQSATAAPLDLCRVYRVVGRYNTGLQGMRKTRAKRTLYTSPGECCRAKMQKLELQLPLVRTASRPRETIRDPQAGYTFVPYDIVFLRCGTPPR